MKLKEKLQLCSLLIFRRYLIDSEKYSGNHINVRFKEDLVLQFAVIIFVVRFS